MKILLAVALLAEPALAHLMIRFQAKGPSGTQYTVTSSDNVSKTGLVPAGGTANDSVEGFHTHDDGERLTAVFNDGLGAVACAAVDVGIYEPQWHFKLRCLPTFTYDGIARTCASACPDAALLPPDPNAQPKVFPNPVRHGSEAMSFTNLPASARVRIYSLSGRLVFSGTSGPDGGLHWHCLDNAGHHVGPGVYVALVEGDGRTIKLKLAVQH